MTNEIEKIFFDTFGIGPREFKSYDINSFCYEGQVCDSSCPHYRTYKIDYPKITDHILLELICIHNQYSHPLTIYSIKKEFFKKYILECMIDIINYFYEHEMGEYSELTQQVRKLFEKE